MASQTRAQLTTFITNNITTNGSNAITGAQMNTILQDLIDSCLNLTDDSTSLALDIYRTASVAVVKDVVEQVTFSTPLTSNSYQVFFSDPDGLGTELVTDLQTTGFKFTTLATGNITYLVMLNN